MCGPLQVSSFKRLLKQLLTHYYIYFHPRPDERGLLGNGGGKTADRGIILRILPTRSDLLMPG